MFTPKVISAIPEGIRISMADVSRRTKEIVGVFSTVVVFVMEAFIASKIGFSSPWSIVPLAVAAVTILLSSWQSDLTRRPDSVIGAFLGTVSWNAPFLFALSLYALITGTDALVPAIMCLIASAFGLVVAACCLDMFSSTRRAVRDAASSRKVKAVIVPGKILIDGIPQWQLRRRCWKAMEMLEEDPALIVVCCGGIAKNAAGDTKVKRESAVMKDVIVESASQRGMEDGEVGDLLSRVLEEPGSSTTQGNFENLAKIFDRIGFDYKNVRFGIVTADYHEKRCLYWARRSGFSRLTAIPVRTQWDSAFADWNQEFYIQMCLISKGDNWDEREWERAGNRSQAKRETASKGNEKSPEVDDGTSIQRKAAANKEES